jgi:hypothetical protein
MPKHSGPAGHSQPNLGACRRQILRSPHREWFAPCAHESASLIGNLLYKSYKVAC